MDTVANTLELIAHRGGVVEQIHPENSPAALDEAVQRGYHSVEIDLRTTSDNKVVCYHDASVANGFLRRERVRDLSLSELRGRVGSWVLTIDEMLDRCVGRVEVMIDVKEEGADEAFFAQIYESLAAHQLLESALVIGTRRAKDYLSGSARTAVSVREIRRGEREITSLDPGEFLFGHGTELDDRTVSETLEAEVLLVPSINRFHYLPRLDVMTAAGEDIARLLTLGCRVFQIDSEFGRFFPGHRQ